MLNDNLLLEFQPGRLDLTLLVLALSESNCNGAKHKANDAKDAEYARHSIGDVSWEVEVSTGINDQLIIIWVDDCRAEGTEYKLPEPVGGGD